MNGDKPRGFMPRPGYTRRVAGLRTYETPERVRIRQLNPDGTISPVLGTKPATEFSSRFNNRYSYRSKSNGG